MQAASTIVRIENATINRGQQGTIRILVDATGQENAVGFSVIFDPALLSYSQARLGSGGTGGSLNVNDSQKGSGKVGIGFALAAGGKLASGTAEVVLLDFVATFGSSTVTTPLTFGDTPIAREVSDPTANVLPGTFSGGTATLTGAGGGSTCTADASTLCLLNNRFRVTATYKDYGGNTGTGKAVPLTSDTGTFWFFNAANVEGVIKMVSFCGNGGSNAVAVYGTGLTDLGVTYTVVDTATGSSKNYSNPLGTGFKLIRDGPFTCLSSRDGDAFFVDNDPRHEEEPVAPEYRLQPAAACTADANSLCLLANRFKVTATYKDYGGNIGSGKAVPLTSDTGYFWFFTSSNVEAVVKLVDFCSSSSPKYAVYANGLTDIEVSLTVTDSQTGLSATYRNPLGKPFELIRDGAFGCSSTGGSKVPWTATPITADGNVTSAEWANAYSVALPHGTARLLNDASKLYVLVDVTGDTGNDQPPTTSAWGDSLDVAFDVNRNGVIDSQVDVDFRVNSDGTGSVYKYMFLGTNSIAGPYAKLAQQARAFGPSPFSSTPHRVWELVIPLADIGGAPGQPAKVGFRTVSTTPSFDDRVPSDLMTSFASYTTLTLSSAP